MPRVKLPNTLTDSETPAALRARVIELYIQHCRGEAGGPLDGSERRQVSQWRFLKWLREHRLEYREGRHWMLEQDPIVVRLVEHIGTAEILALGGRQGAAEHAEDCRSKLEDYIMTSSPLSRPAARVLILGSITGYIDSYIENALR